MIKPSDTEFVTLNGTTLEYMDRADLNIEPGELVIAKIRSQSGFYSSTRVFQVLSVELLENKTRKYRATLRYQVLSVELVEGKPHEYRATLRYE